MQGRDRESRRKVVILGQVLTEIDTY